MVFAWSIILLKIKSLYQILNSDPKSNSKPNPDHKGILVTDLALVCYKHTYTQTLQQK